MEQSIALVCLGLMAIAYLWKKQALMVAAGLAWMVFTFWNRQEQPVWGVWDVHELLFFLGLAMMFICFAEAIVLARKVPKEDIEAEQRDRNKYLEMEDYDTAMARLRGRRR